MQEPLYTYYHPNGDWHETPCHATALENSDGSDRCMMDLMNLRQISDDVLDRLDNQWRLAHRNGWTSLEADWLIGYEVARRDALESARLDAWGKREVITDA